MVDTIRESSYTPQSQPIPSNQKQTTHNYMYGGSLQAIRDNKVIIAGILILVLGYVYKQKQKEISHNQGSSHQYSRNF